MSFLAMVSFDHFFFLLTMISGVSDNHYIDLNTFKILK